ncbi:hypothetical protein PENCOP_c008G02343 [Penicillium coprophilum]|uniref:Uncharacterized protein n=1 Tax=Penicillium coprophilum TaxID=36646 RepID=A0A1V6UJU9_9EURO|nr:hypothetical protein PENCOP_c008G02343 [Penicillium coprophilum]
MRFVELSIWAQFAISVSGLAIFKTLGVRSTIVRAPVPTLAIPRPDDPALEGHMNRLNKGTNIHVSRGCILINGSKRCETFGGPYNVMYQGLSENKATIYAEFDGDETPSQVKPGCKLTASWDAEYSDLDFNNNCLKDRSGKYSKCCDDTTTTDDLVNNPYDPTLA